METDTGRARQCPAGLDKVRLGWTLSDRDLLFWVIQLTWSLAQIDNFHFIHHTPSNSTVLLYSGNIKTNCSTA
jgi:hypothetical protein